MSFGEILHQGYSHEIPGSPSARLHHCSDSSSQDHFCAVTHPWGHRIHKGFSKGLHGFRWLVSHHWALFRHGVYGIWPPCSRLWDHGPQRLQLQNLADCVRQWWSRHFGKRCHEWWFALCPEWTVCQFQVACSRYFLPALQPFRWSEVRSRP